MSKKRQPAVSLIIPVYNETVRLISGLYHVLTYLSAARFSWEIIIVDDGSEKPVIKVLKDAKNRKILHFPLSRLPIYIYRMNNNCGKVKAIRFGVSKSRGRYIVFTDADLSVPINQLAGMLSLLSNYPIVIGSRRLKKSKILIHQSIFREAAGRIFTVLSNVLCAVRVADATCGFKGFQRDAAKHLFAASRIHRWVFDTEIIFLGRKYDYAIFEMPVDWTNKKGSKVRIGDSAQALYDLFRIRWYDARGEYDK
jgi:dolichyl-phosphate beta-glucosyltransferase